MDGNGAAAPPAAEPRQAGAKRWGRGAVVHLVLGAAISTLTALAFTYVPVLRQIELNTLDLRYRRRAPIPTVPQLGTIDIDAAVINRVGSWPVPRTFYAELLRTLHAYDARLMLMDVFFPDPSPLAVSREQIHGAVRALQDGGDPQAVGRRLSRMTRGADEQMAEAMADTRLAVLAQTFTRVDADACPTDADVASLTRELAATALSPRQRHALELADRHAVAFDAPGGWADPRARACLVEPPIPDLLEHAAGLGFAQVILDADGTVRRYPLWMHYDGCLYPSLALMGVSLVSGVPLASMRVVPGRHVVIPGARLPGEDGVEQVRDIRIPVDRSMRMMVNWAGDYLATFTHFPGTVVLQFRAVDLVRERVREFADRPGELIESGFETIARDVAELGLLGPTEAELTVRNLLLAQLAETAQGDGSVDRSGFLDSYAAEDDAETRRLLAEIWDKVRWNHAILERLEQDPEAPYARLVAELAEPGSSGGAPMPHAVEFLRFLVKRGKDPERWRPLYFFPPVEVVSGGQTVHVSPLDLADKVLFVGLTATATHDLNPMPFSPRYPMVGLHVNAANTVLTGRFIRRLSAWWTFAIGLGLALLMVFSTPRLHPLAGAAMMLGVVVGYAYAGQAGFAQAGVWLPVASPLATAVVAYLVVVIGNVVREQREKLRIRHAFSTYMTPSVVDAVLKNPHMLRLGGERREMTVYFSDLQSFTTISETLAPEDLVVLLNEYLSSMTEIIFRQEGTLDKYEGDAVMAFWNAPLEQEDHAFRGCCAALDSVQHLREVLWPKWRAEGKPLLDVRIGINTGPMIVGNLGSSTRMDYTVTGDAVNLGSRLEEANKQFGTRIIMSEYTRAHVRGRILDRDLGVITVAGRKQPVRVYEVLGRAAAPATG